MGWKINEVYDPKKRRRITAALQASVSDMCHEEPMTAEKANILAGVGKIEFWAGGGVESLRSVQPARPFVSTDEAKLNKTERAFLAYLRVSQRSVGVQDITFKLADDCRYTPDLTVWGYDASHDLTCFEVKGFWREDARVKIKVAARKFCWVRFIAVQRVKGEWKFEEIKP